MALWTCLPADRFAVGLPAAHCLSRITGGNAPDS